MRKHALLQMVINALLQPEIPLFAFLKAVVTVLEPMTKSAMTETTMMMMVVHQIALLNICTDVSKIAQVLIHAQKLQTECSTLPLWTIVKHL